MAEFPSGTVTFLFTDIEGSTRLLRTLRDRYREVRDAHHRVLRAAFQAHGGQEVGTEGDAFFVAFRRARDAVAAATAAQLALANEEWPPGAAVKVRMGIHTGEPAIDEEGYMGLVVHFAARLTSAGHGGQVLLSRTTRELVADDLPDGVRVRELGTHQLKDFERPEPIYQLVVDGLREDFPPLRTLPSRPEKLGAARRDEVARAAEAALAQGPRIRRRELLAFALIGVLAAAVSIPVFALGRGSSSGSSSAAANSIIAIDPATNGIVEDVPVGPQPTEVVSAAGAVWVLNSDNETVTRIDPRTSMLVRTIPANNVQAIASAPSGVWLLRSSAGSASVEASRIDPRYDVITSTTKVPGAAYGGEPGGIAASRAGVWVVPGGIGRVTRINPASGATVATIDAASCCPASVTADAGAVWVADPYANAVTHIDMENDVEAVIPVGHGPTDVAADSQGVWVAVRQDDQVARIDPQTNAVETTIPVGDSPVAVALGAGSVWSANAGDGTVSRIDPTDNRVIATIDVGRSVHGIAVADGRVWVSVQQSSTQSPVAAGEARLTAFHDVDALDPAVAYVPLPDRSLRSPISWQIEYATCAKLVDYPDRPAPAGSIVEPEVARSLPRVTRGGLTYVFTLRRGFRFSPPSNQPVTAATFKYSIERALSPQLDGPARPQQILTARGARAGLEDVVGAVSYGRGRSNHIQGIVARGDTLTFRLVRPVPDFLYRLAQPFFCAVPLDTPMRRTIQPIPSAGPYYIASYSAGRELVLKRNPNYIGMRPHRLRELRISFGVTTREAINRIEGGRADYALDGIPPSENESLSQRFGSRSPSARAGKQRYFVNPTLDFYFIALNASRPLFADARRRRAVNYAIDRRRLAHVLGSIFLAEPTDHYLPPTMAGFRDTRIYPSTAQPARARRLAGHHSGAAVLYTCGFLCSPIAQAIQADLGAIGIDVSVREFSLTEEERRIRRRGEPFDLAFSAWTADYPDPATFIEPLFDGSSIRPANNYDIAYFSDPKYIDRIKAAAHLTGPARDRAFGQLDVDLAREAAPLVAVAVRVRQDFFSERTGCQIYNPAYGMDLAALCLRQP